MKKNKAFIILLVLTSTFFLNSCVTKNSTEQTEDMAVKDSIPNEILQSTKTLFSTLPDPTETAELIQKADITFDEKILNPVHNLPYYETSQSMAINLGIYCADLSYTCLFDQKQVTMQYLVAVKSMTNDLGLIHLLNQEDMVKLESNLYNKDSIKIMIHNLFLSSGEFLNDNNRPDIALLVQAGGWIEGLYLAMQLAKQSGTINKELVDRIVEQYESLIILINAMKNFEKIQGIPEILADLNNLKLIYDKILVQDNSPKDEPNLAKNAKANVTPELFLSLYHETLNIRNSYTQ